LIPFFHFARDGNERTQFLNSLLSGVSPIVNATQPAGSAKEGLNDFIIYLRFLQECWETRPEFAVSQLSANVFGVVYGDAAEQAGLTDAKCCFRGEPPFKLHIEVIEFLRNLRNAGLFLLRFLSFPRMPKMLGLIFLWILSMKKS
jgi:hypothetical protein